MPAMIRTSGQMWNKENKSQDNDDHERSRSIEDRLALALELLFDVGEPFVDLLLQRVNVYLFVLGG